MKVRIERLKPPYPSCEECWNRNARFRVIIRYGKGNKEKEVLNLCKIHLNQTILIAKKLLKAFKRVKE